MHCVADDAAARTSNIRKRKKTIHAFTLLYFLVDFTVDSVKIPILRFDSALKEVSRVAWLYYIILTTMLILYFHFEIFFLSSLIIKRQLHDNYLFTITEDSYVMTHYC